MNNTFKTLTEFNKIYDEVRVDILNRHNIKDHSKARLKNAIKLYQLYNGQWLPITSVKTNMIDRLKQYEAYDMDAEFKLEAMV